MPAGELIKGEDGIINLLDPVTGNVIGEVPCLTQWSIDASASINERSAKCMKSNGDGGSGSTANWTNATVESRSASISMEFYWQKNQAIPAGVKLDPTNVGDSVNFELFPEDNIAGGIVYTGTAVIESAPISSEVAGDITTSVTLKLDGKLTKAVII